MPGITAKIIGAGAQAYKVAYSEAFKTVFLATIAFTGLGIILAVFVPNVEKLMTDKVGVTLHKTRKPKAAGGEAA